MNLDSIAINPSGALIPKDVYNTASLDWSLQCEVTSAVAAVKVHQSLKDSFISSEGINSTDMEFLQQTTPPPCPASVFTPIHRDRRVRRRDLKTQREKSTLLQIAKETSTTTLQQPWHQPHQQLNLQSSVPSSRIITLPPPTPQAPPSVADVRDEILDRILKNHRKTFASLLGISPLLPIFISSCTLDALVKNNVSLLKLFKLIPDPSITMSDYWTLFELNKDKQWMEKLRYHTRIHIDFPQRFSSSTARTLYQVTWKTHIKGCNSGFQKYDDVLEWPNFYSALDLITFGFNLQTELSLPEMDDDEEEKEKSSSSSSLASSILMKKQPITIRVKHPWGKLRRRHFIDMAKKGKWTYEDARTLGLDMHATRKLKITQSDIVHLRWDLERAVSELHCPDKWTILRQL